VWSFVGPELCGHLLIHEVEMISGVHAGF